MFQMVIFGVGADVRGQISAHAQLSPLPSPTEHSLMRTHLAEPRHASQNAPLVLFLNAVSGIRNLERANPDRN